MKADSLDTLIKLLRIEGISDEHVLHAMRQVKREDFVDPQCQAYAYCDTSLPLKAGQTISQPYVVARMTEALLGQQAKLQRVLEIGTGSGYQAAILSHLADEVYSIERIKVLYDCALQHLQPFKNVHLLYGDGYQGWPEHAPYDGIIVTAAANKVPEALKQQLAEAGRLVMPVGEPGSQRLQVLTKRADSYTIQFLDYVLFVPMLTGKT